jgi:hypothetical protein
MVLSVLTRVRRLELAQIENPAAAATRPYGQIRGRSVTGLLPAGGSSEPPRRLLFLSSNCRPCADLLGELAGLRDAPPIGLLWMDRAPEALPTLPAAVVSIPNGAAVARELGIRVTPFLVELDAQGVILDGRPVNRLASLEMVSNGKVAAQVA